MHTVSHVSRLSLLTSLALCAACAVEPGDAGPERTDKVDDSLVFDAAVASGGKLKFQIPTGPTAVSLQGILSELAVGRARSTGQSGGARYLVMTAERSLQEVEISAAVAAAAGGLKAMLGRSVVVQGSSYSARGALVASSVSLGGSASKAVAAPAFGDVSLGFTGTKRWLTIPCAFSDLPNPSPHGTGYFQALMGSAEPGLGHYLATASHGRLSLESTTLDWLPMPKPASFYAVSTSAEKLDDLVSDCISNAYFADPALDVFGFDGFSLVFSHNLENQIVAGTLQTPDKTVGFAVLSPVEYAHQASVARAVGAGMDFTYSGTAPLAFDSPWDVMSQGFALAPSGLSCRSLTPSFGCAAVFPAAEHRAQAGWLLTSEIATAADNARTTVDLDFAGATPLSGHHGIIRVPINGTSYYTIEARKQDPATYDSGLPKTSLVIHRMNTAPLPDEPSQGDILEAATRLRLVSTPSGASGLAQLGDASLTYTEQASGYRIIVDRVPPAPQPQPDPEPEPEPEPEDCWSRCRGPVYKCEQICGGY